MKLNRHFRNISALAVSTVVGISTTQAAVTVSQASAAPTTNVVTSQTAPGTGSPWRFDGDKRDSGQTFLVGAGGFTLDAITVNISTLEGSGYDGGGFTLAINTYADGTTASPSSNVVTESGTLSASMFTDFGSGDTYLTFDITDLALTGGQQYGFFLEHTGSDTTTNMLLAAKIGSGYTDGIGLKQGPEETTLWNGSNSVPADLEFYLQGQAVPEPTTTALLGLGGLALILRRRR